MKKASILTIMIAFLAISTFAQNTASPQRRPMPTPEERAKHMTDRMNAQLQLSPDQYQKILDINKDFVTQTESLRTPGQQITDEARTKMRTLNKEKEEKINAVLTAEQRTKRQEAPKGPRPANMRNNTMQNAPSQGK